jgi:predicted nucleic acid-binding protein
MQHIILDTNSWLSYIITQKLPDLVNLIYSNDLVLYGSEPLYDELKEV